MPTRILTMLLSALLMGGVVGTASPVVAQSQCSFSGQLKLRPDQIMLESDPVLGNPSADVILIEFFDPNCTPCQRFHPIMKKVMETYGDRIKYYMHPIPVWKYSLRQIEAILLSKEKGKYYEMIDQQLEHPQEKGLDVEDLVAMADSVGIDSEWMRRRIEENAVRKQVGRISYQAQRAGVKNTPTFSIGRRIISSSQSPSCIGRLIERTLQRTETK